MKVLVPVKRVIDYNVKGRVKADGSGVDLANVKMSMNPFDENATGQMLAALTGWAQGAFASELDVDGDTATVTREVDGGLQTIKIKMPAIVTVDLRLNEPRYASLPNIMKAKKKPLDEKTPADYGVDVTNRLAIVGTAEPETRAAGIIVGSVDELAEKLKEVGAV